MPWFLFMLAALALCVVALRRRGASRAALTISIAICVLLAATCWPGKFYVEKMLTELALPLGFAWFVLLVTGLALIMRKSHRRIATILLIVCGLLSAAGNYVVANAIIASLERPYRDRDPLDETPFDAICVLGGGAWVNFEGHPVISRTGDRIVVGARLYHAHKAPLLVCTGGDLQPAPNLPNVADMTATVLTELGVPSADLVKGGGDTTKTELAVIRGLIKRNGWKRVGVVTSAWHMPRVERLARAAGVDVIPLPADFETSAPSGLPFRDKFRRFSIIPNAGALEQTHAGFKEYLAALAGR